MTHHQPAAGPSLPRACPDAACSPSYRRRLSQDRCGTIVFPLCHYGKGVENPLPRSEPPAMKSHEMPQFASLLAETSGCWPRRETTLRSTRPQSSSPLPLSRRVFHSVTFPSAKVPIYTCSAIKTVPATHISQLRNKYERARMVQIWGRPLVERLEECLRRLPRAALLSAFVVESTRRIPSLRNIHA